MKNKKYFFLFIVFCLFININNVYAEKTLGNGNYIISSKLNLNKNVDVAGARTANGTNIRLWDANSDNAQRWQINYLDTGYYVFHSLLNTDKCLSIKNDNYTLGTNIELSDCNNSDLQQFEIKDLGNGYFSVVTKENSLYIDVAGARTANGTNIALWENNGNDAQKWYFTEVVENKKSLYNGTYMLKSSMDNNKNMDVAGARTVNGTNIRLWDNNNNNAQKWYIEYLENGYYIMRSKLNTNKCISINNSNYVIHSNIILSDCTKKDNQQFIIKDLGNSNYSFISKEKHLYINIFNSSTDNGANIELYYKNDKGGQIFNIVKSEIAKKTLGNGNYSISSALSLSKNMDVAGARTANGTNIRLWDANSNDAQRWKIVYLENGYYNFHSLLDNNKCLSIANSSYNIGSNIELSDCNNSEFQQFEIKDLGNGYFSIIAKNNDVYFDVAGARTANGTNIRLWNGNGDSAQKWYFSELINANYSIDDGVYVITSNNDNTKNFDVAGARTANGTNIRLWNNNDNDAQKWLIEYQNNGYYTIKSKLNTKKCLEIKDSNYVIHSNIQLSSCTKKDNQLFIIKDLGNGTFNFISKVKHLYINTYNGETNNGTNVELFYNNDSNSQKFKLTTIEKTSLNNGTYIITSDLDNTKNIDVAGARSFNGTNIHFWENNGNNAQKWYIKRLNNGYYTIRSGLNSEFYLSYTKEENNANVELSKTATEWELEYYKSNKYYIVTKNKKLYLNINNGNNSNGTNINLLTYSNTKQQVFKFIDTDINQNSNTISDSYYTIETSLNQNQVIDVSAASKLNGTNIALWEKNNNNAQTWYIKHIGNGYYTIVSSMNIKTSLDLANGNTSNGTNIQLWKTNNSDAQTWKFVDDQNGYLSIKSKKGNICLTTKNGNYSNGTNIQIETCNNSQNQKFKLNRYTGTKKYTGIDVSQYQGNINWQKVANTKLGFVIIRLGYGDNWTSQDDKKFATNVENCEKYNIPYGVYLYSYAKKTNGTTALNKDSESAQSEAAHAIRLINSVSYKPNLKTSVYIDMEEDTLAHLGKTTLTNIANKFCQTISNNGYECSTYANNNWLKNNLNAKSLFNNNSIWIAEWISSNSHNTALASKPGYNLTNYKLWQFSSTGKIDGITGNVDMNIGYNIFD